MLNRMGTPAGRLRLGHWPLIAWAAAAAVVVSAARPVLAEEDPLEHARSLSRAFRQAAESTLPTVVEIETRVKPRRVPAGEQENPFKGTPFEQFFNEHSIPFQNPDQSPRAGLGSGVIIDSAGIILTNNHVVEGADEVLVRLADGREFRSTDVKTDPETDLAVVRISGAGSLPAARLGNSDALEIGDWVIAVGNPFGQEQTVTAGIISGKERQLAEARRTNFLQTDAAINPGNSGGPLVNLEGEVIGINTAIATNSGGYQGIGFAVPINLAKWVTGQLVETGVVRRAYLGVQIRPVDASLAEVFQVPQREGALVTEVYPGTPAAEAGFAAGDLIVEFAGRKVRNPSELQAMVERVDAGKSHAVGIIRDGRRMSIDVVAKPLPVDFASQGGPSAVPPSASQAEPETYENSELGFSAATLDEETSSQLGFEGHQGVLVTRVEADSAAAESGLRRGMLILSVGRKRTPVTTVDEFREAISGESLDEGVLLLVRAPRGGQDFLLLKKAE